MLGLVWIGGYSEVRRTGGATMESIVEGLERDRITHVMLVPSLLRELVSRPDLMERLSASTLEWIVTGAEPVPRSVIEVVCRGIPDVDVCQGYGLSEFPTITTVLMADEVFDHEGSAGRALPHTDLAIRDADGAIRRTGTGELLVRSLATMIGYHQRPEQTAEAFRDGWLHTGDLVELDADGFITIVGRTKDMIISGGLNVYPKEIEDVISRLPGVVEAAVVGVPHERFGETAVAVVVTDEADFDPASVEAACAEQLASFKRPRVTIVRQERLPRNANAKLLKRELRRGAGTRPVHHRGRPACRGSTRLSPAAPSRGGHLPGSTTRVCPAMAGRVGRRPGRAMAGRRRVVIPGVSPARATPPACAMGGDPADHGLRDRP